MVSDFWSDRSYNTAGAHVVNKYSDQVIMPEAFDNYLLSQFSCTGDQNMYIRGAVNLRKKWEIEFETLFDMRVILATNCERFLQNSWNWKTALVICSEPLCHYIVGKSSCPQQQICKEDKESRVAYALSAFVEFKEIALCCLLAAA